MEFIIGSRVKVSSFDTISKRGWRKIDPLYIKNIGDARYPNGSFFYSDPSVIINTDGDIVYFYRNYPIKGDEQTIFPKITIFQKERRKSSS